MERVDWVDLGCQICDFETWSLHFGTLEKHFGELGAHRDILEGHLGPRVRFYWFWDDFGILFGFVFGSCW